jgi:hypothetical protein
MKIFIVITALALSFVLVLNNQSNAKHPSQWTVAQQNKFYNDCLRGAATNPSTTVEFNQYYCSCMLRIVQERYSTPAQTLNMSKDEMMRLAKICAAEFLSR